MLRVGLALCSLLVTEAVTGNEKYVGKKLDGKRTVKYTELKIY